MPTEEKKHEEPKANEQAPAPMKKAALKEEKELMLQKCLICFEEFPETKITVLDVCKHFFCTGCMKDYIKSKIDNGDFAHLKCCHRCKTVCNRTITKEEVQRIMLPEIFEEYTRRMKEHELITQGGLHCPNPKFPKGCGAIVMPIEKGNMRKCEKCSYAFCSNPGCKVLSNVIPELAQWHEGKTCEQWQDEVLGRGLQASGSKQCPGIIGKDANGIIVRCPASLQKNEGCNHMTCPKCKHNWCWTCQYPHQGEVPNMMGAWKGSTAPCAFPQEYMFGDPGKGNPS